MSNFFDAIENSIKASYDGKPGKDFAEDFSYTTVSFMNETTSRKIMKRNQLTESILGGIVLGISVYLTSATLCYHFRLGKQNMQKANFLCSFAVVSLLVRIVAIHVLLYGGHIDDRLCNAALVFSYVCFGFNRFLPYVVLWLRQRTIYKNSNQGSSNTKKIKIISYVTLVGIVVFQPALTTLQIIFTRFVSSPLGCVLADKSVFFNFLQKASPIFFGASALFQLLLLSLVLYPLCQHCKSNNFKSEKVRNTIIRLAICTSICIVSDLAFLLAKHLQPRSVSSLLTALFSCCDNTINFMSMLASFTDFRSRFFPVLLCKSPLFSFSTSLKKSSNTEETEARSGSRKKSKTST